MKSDTSGLSAQLGSDIIKEFREKHGNTAYPCRYRFCPRSSSGFPTEQQRETHETSHRPRIKCSITSCEFHVFGFASKHALERHFSHYHPDRELMGSQDSRLIRRKFDLALRTHFMEADRVSNHLKRPRNDAVSQFSP